MKENTFNSFIHCAKLLTGSVYFLKFPQKGLRPNQNRSMTQVQVATHQLRNTGMDQLQLDLSPRWEIATPVRPQHTEQQRGSEASLVCVSCLISGWMVSRNDTFFLFFCADMRHMRHTWDDLISAQQPATQSLSQACCSQPVWGAPLVPPAAGTCDDDLGDVQNGAKGRRFTVASFILRGCCKNTHIHTRTHARRQTDTHAQTRTYVHRAANTNTKHADAADWGVTAPPGLELHTCRAYGAHVQEAACTPPSFQVLRRATKKKTNKQNKNNKNKKTDPCWQRSIFQGR